MRAIAEIKGGNGYPQLYGKATFIQTDLGVLVTIKVNNLPKSTICNGGVFALHIHEGESCNGNANDQFSNAKTHIVSTLTTQVTSLRFLAIMDLPI